VVRLLADENFNDDVVAGMLALRPNLDFVRAREVGLDGVNDPGVLAWAAANDRIVVTHDKKTMPPFAYTRVASGLPMPGVFVVDDWAPVGRVIDNLLLIDDDSQQVDWVNRVEFLPW
jgi:hypothetical protein